MSNFQKSVPGTAVATATLAAIVAKCLGGYPLLGTHIGGGVHVTMPPTWDGTGLTPPGWTKAPQAVWSATALDAQLPITDAMAALLAIPANQARLTAPELATLNAGLAARVLVDIEAGTYIPQST
jgi:hypothetical protein